MLLTLTLVLLAVHTSAAEAASCQLQLPQNLLTFDKCLLVEGVGSNYNVMWSLSPDGQRVTWGMNATVDGYVGLGFPPADSDNVMVGTNAFLLQTCDDCPSGAQIRQVYMSGTTSGDMQPSTTIQTAGVVASEVQGGWLVGTFSTDLLMTANSEQTNESFMAIFASGAVYRNGDIRMHSTYGETTLNLLTGEAEDPETFTKPISALVAAHIWLLLIGWGFFAPVGVLCARSLKHKEPLWFQLHRTLLSLGLLMGIVGLGLGFAISGGWNGAFPVHRNLGLASIILGVLQGTAWVLRPTFVSKYRRTWNIWHWWQGRAAIVLGVANIYYGLTKIVDTGSYGWGVYTAIFALIVFLAIAKESYEYIQLPPPGVEKHMATDGSRPSLVGLTDVEMSNGAAAGSNGNASTYTKGA